MHSFSNKPNTQKVCLPDLHFPPKIILWSILYRRACIMLWGRESCLPSIQMTTLCICNWHGLCQLMTWLPFPIGEVHGRCTVGWPSSTVFYNWRARYLQWWGLHSMYISICKIGYVCIYLYILCNMCIYMHLNTETSLLFMLWRALCIKHPCYLSNNMHHVLNIFVIHAMTCIMY